MRTVLYVNPSGDVSGGEKSLLVLLEGIRDEYRPVVACPGGRFTKACEELGVPAFPLSFSNPARSSPWTMLVLRPLQTIRMISEIRRIAMEQRAELIHANSYLVGPACSIVARRMGIPVIWHIRDIRSGIKSRVVSALASSLADRVICVSQAVCDAFYGSKILAKSEVIYNGVNSMEVSGDERLRCRSALGLPPDVPLVGNVGVLLPWKGQDLFLRVAARVLEDKPDTWFVIVGDEPSSGGGYRSQLENLAVDLGVADRVIFTGFRDDALSIIASMDAYLHTAMQPDPLPRAVLEAMALGVPVIAPGTGGIPEAIIHGESGLLYGNADADDIGYLVRSVLDSEEMSSRIREHAVQRVCSVFDVDSHISSVKRVYAGLVAPDGGGR